MMDRLALEFQGATTEGLLPLLAVGVSVMLGVWGVVQILGGQRRVGLLALGAALGPPLALAALAGDAAWCFVQGRPREGRRSLLGAVLVAVLMAAGVAVWLAVPSWPWAAVLAVHVAVAVGIIYASIFAFLGGRRLAALTVLRWAAVVALLGILLKPVLLVHPDSDAHKPALPILVDASASMATTDEADMPSRFAQVGQMLRSQQGRIGRHFRPAWISFGGEPAAEGSLEALLEGEPDGEATDIAAALWAARDPAGRQAGIILLTDGIDNAGKDVRAAAEELGLPVYAVAVGSRDERAVGRPNLRLLDVDAPMEVTTNNVAEITARVRMTRFANIGGELRLYEGESVTPVATEKLWTAAEDETVTARLRWTPPAQGDGPPMRRLRVEVAPSEREVSTVDNRSELHVLLTDPKLRVLYIEGSPRPEYKFLRRALATDPNVQLMGLVRVGETRFFVQGSVDGQRLEGLPTTAEQFGLFDVIVFGSLDSSFLPAATRQGLEAFVNDGGGLVMLGGEASFGPGGHAETPLENLLPVELGDRSMRQVSDAFLPQLTAAGEAHPIFAGIEGYFRGPGGRRPKPALARLPELTGCVEVARAKAAASVLAVHPTAVNEAGPLVVLAVQQVGAGRTAAFTADTTWQWYMPMRPMGAASPYYRFWGQMIRWLAHVETRSREAGAVAMLRLPRTHTRVGQVMAVLAKVQDTEGQPAHNATVTVGVHRIDDGTPEAEAVETLSLATGGDGGSYRAEWTPRQAGQYVLRLAATSSREEPLGRDELAVVAEQPSRELESLARNDELLRDVALVSSGQYADVTGLPDLLDRIIDRQRQLAGPAPRATVHRLYNFALLFVAFVVCLTGEWLLRRRWQLQ